MWSGPAVSLIDAYVIESRVQFSNQPGKSVLDVYAMDPTVLMSLEEKVRAWPNMKHSDIAQQIFSEYLRCGAHDFSFDDLTTGLASARSFTRSSWCCQKRSNVFVHSWRGRRAIGSVRYRMDLPHRRARTSPTFRRTFRCFETDGWARCSRTTICPTERSSSAR